MDSRRRDYTGGGADPRKRNASQSPDGAQPRKQQRQGNGHDSGLSPAQSDSRRSSMPNGSTMTPPPNPGAPNTLRRPSDAPAVSSPHSPYESTVSGRSTPQQRASALSNETSAQPTRASSVPSTDANVDPSSLKDLLTKFSSNLSIHAALENERRLAELQYSSTKREFSAAQQHFTAFPAVKEQKITNKEVAHDVLQAKEKSLLEHTSSQQSAIQMLASLIEQLATPKPNPDLVTRAEYDALQKDYTELRKEVMSLKQLRTELTAVRDDLTIVEKAAHKAQSESGQVPRFCSDIDQLKNDTTVLNSDTTTLKDDVTMLKKWRLDTDVRVQDIRKLDQRLNNIGAASNDTRKELDDFKIKGVSTLVTKEQVTVVKKQIAELERQNAALQKESDDRHSNYDILSQNVGNLQKAQAKATADNLNSLAANKNPTLDSESKARLDVLIEEQTKLKEQVATLLNQGAKVFDFVEDKVKEAVAGQDTMTRTLNQLEEDFSDAKERLTFIQDSVEEEGKDTIVKRIKNLDVLVNNMSSQIQDSDWAPLLQRVTQLEKDSQALKHARTEKFVQQPNPSSEKPTDGTVAYSTTAETRLNGIEIELKDLIAQQEEKDTFVAEMIEAVDKSLRDDVGRVNQSLREDVGKRIQSLKDSGEKVSQTLSDNVERVNQSLRDNVQKVDQSLRDEVEKVNQTLREDLGNVKDDLTVRLDKTSEGFDARLGKTAESINANVQGIRDQCKRSAGLFEQLTERCRVIDMSVQQALNDFQGTIDSKASAESIEALKIDLSTLATDVKKLQVDHQRTKSTSQAPPATQANGPQPQQIPSGINGSPQISDGQQRFSPHAVPYPSGHGSAQQPPSQEIQNSQNMQTQINGLVGVYQQLKMRCDNLQTDEIVRAMVDQFSTMYPEARNFKTSVRALQSNFNSVQQQIALLQQERANPVEQFNEDVKKATAKAEGAHGMADTAWQQAQKQWLQIDTLKDKVRTLEAEAEKWKNDPKASSPQRELASNTRISADLKSIRSELDQTTKSAAEANKTATAAESLSKQHSSRFSKIQPEQALAALKEKVAALESTVQDHAQKLGNGAPALKNLQEAAAQAKSELERVKKHMGAFKGRVELLEKGVSDT